MPRWLSRILSGDEAAPAPSAGGVVAGPSGGLTAGGARDDVPALRRRLDADVREVDAAAGEAPAEAVVVARQVLDLAGDVLRHAQASVEAGDETGGIDIHGRVALDAVLRDYLPTTFRTFLAARRADAATGGHEAGVLTDQLLDQLAALRDSVRETVAALRENDLRALEIQGVFLRTKFSGSDL